MTGEVKGYYIVLERATTARNKNLDWIGLGAIKCVCNRLRAGRRTKKKTVTDVHSCSKHTSLEMELSLSVISQRNLTQD